VFATTDVPKVKGLAFIEALKWYSKTRGQGRVVEAVRATPARLTVHVSDLESPSLGLLPGSWYPSELVQHIFTHFCVGLTKQQIRQLGVDLARAGVANTLTGMYATFTRLLVTPDLIAAHYQKIWRLYQSTGRCEVLPQSPTQHELRVHAWPAHFPLFCTMVMAGTKNIYEIVGCKNVTSTIATCVDQRSPYCSYTLSWDG
jgi:hypothetical protein